MSSTVEVGVERVERATPFVRIGDLCSVFNGFAFKSELFNTARVGLPLIRIRDVNSGYSNTYYSGEFEERYLVRDGDILIGMDGDFGITRWRHGPGLLNQRVCRIENVSRSVWPEYLYHQLRSALQTIHRGIQSSTVKHLSSRELANFRIPVPPLAIQASIAGALGEYEEAEAELEVELEAELQARRTQYVQYRQQLLPSSEVEGVTCSTLGAVSVSVTSGGTPPTGNAEYYGGDIPWLRTQEVNFGIIRSTSVSITEAGLHNSSAKWIPQNCVIVAMYGATAAKVAVNEIPLTTNQACCNLQIDPSIADFRYVFHWVSNEYERLRSLGEGSQSNINAKKVKDYPILLPPLSKQAEIVEALDRFDALINDLSTGLTAELAARRKQYEYYRDKLLTFEEAPA